MSVVPRFSTCPAHRFRRPHSVRRRLAPALAGLAAQIALLGVPESAQACGGLFCSASAPVNQAAERIIFAKGSDGTVTQVVEILYEGPSEEFAWVLPVPGVPEFDVSSTVAFDRLQQATNPTYTLVDDQPDSCGGGFFRGSDDAEGAPVLSGAPNDPEVTVLDAGTVGPFDYEVIKVDAADEDAATVAVEWLEANDYDVGALGPEVLRPYLANGMNLLAFKLTKGTDTGAIQPVRLTFESETPSIPIRPTAVAAAENMGILVWVLGDVRAVPINYKGLELNELLINWFNPGPTYDAVVTAAANEAQGQGFVTEMAGSTAGMATTIDRGEESQLINPRPLEESIVSWAQFFGSYDGVERAFEAEVTVRAGLTIQDLLSCPNCYFDPEAYDFTETDYGTYNSATDPIQETDVDRLATALFQEVVNPIQKTAELFETHPYMTRLYTTMSADEMTKDPLFDFNPDLEDVSNVHTADRQLTCDGPSGEWRVTLPDGTRVFGEGNTWPYSATDPGDMPFTARIFEYSTSGTGVIVQDNTARINRLFEDGAPSQINSLGATGDGGGCSVSAAGQYQRGLWLFGALGLVVAGWGRRRAGLRRA